MRESFVLAVARINELLAVHSRNMTLVMVFKGNGRHVKQIVLSEISGDISLWYSSIIGKPFR